MVIEHFKNGVDAVGERFQSQGRMMPPELVYHASWLEPAGTRCFQLMEAPGLEAFQAWTSRWDDLMDFEIIPVVTSAEFWANRR